MSENITALYRKYRPKKFSEIVGQDHVVTALSSALEKNAVAHAYLFSGSRGTGKTSLARILAEEIGTSPNDLYEIDAASNRGIDDVRALRESVGTLPFESKYKVYIIDEVHMLTKEAFNALLKTLEEPPAHVVFVLATTETDKLPETVVSRCQTFSFRKPSVKILKDVAMDVAKKEGFRLEPVAAELVALLGDGSFRDTLGILQKVLNSVSGKNVLIADVEAVTGAPRGVLVNDFVAAVAEKQLELGLAALRKSVGLGIDINLYFKLILQKLRLALLLRIDRNAAAYASEHLSAEDFEFIKKIASDPKTNVSAAVLLEFLSVEDLIGKSSLPELPIEIALAKMTE